MSQKNILNCDQMSPAFHNGLENLKNHKQGLNNEMDKVFNNKQEIDPIIKESNARRKSKVGKEQIFHKRLSTITQKAS